MPLDDTQRQEVADFWAKQPNTLHELLEIALTDLLKAEQAPDNSIDMGEWYRGSDDTWDAKCHMCLAGCVLAVRGVFNSTDNFISYEDLEGEALRKMTIIDYLRKGYILEALEWKLDDCVLGRQCPGLKTHEEAKRILMDAEIDERMFVSEYLRNDTQTVRHFKEDMQRMLRILREANL